MIDKKRLIVGACILAMTGILAGCAQYAAAADAEAADVEPAAVEAAAEGAEVVEAEAEMADEVAAGEAEESMEADDAEAPAALPAGEAAAFSMIESGATFDTLNEAGLAILLDEHGKLMFDPHNAHYDFACYDCHSADGVTAPQLMCNTCHRIVLPGGWTDPEQAPEARDMYVDPGSIYGDLGYGVEGVSYGKAYSNE